MTTEPLADVIRELRGHSCLFHADSEMKVAKSKLALLIAAAEKAERYEKALRDAQNEAHIWINNSPPHTATNVCGNIIKRIVDQALAPEQPAEDQTKS